MTEGELEHYPFEVGIDGILIELGRRNRGGERRRGEFEAVALDSDRRSDEAFPINDTLYVWPTGQSSAGANSSSRSPSQRQVPAILGEMSTPVFTTLPTLCSGATEDSNITWSGLGFGLSTVRTVAAGAVKLKSVRTARGRWRHTSTPAQSATRPTAVAIALRRNARGWAAARARRVAARARSEATQGGADQATSPTVTLRTLTRERYHCSKRGLTKTSRLVKPLGHNRQHDV